MRVSVIIPVYNRERYLYECMDSVKNQSLTEIEIICVDDGSTDRSSEILDGYAAVDSRIKVIHKENSGYGHSVNIGIQQACGEYIGIVEPDDYIGLQMLETLYFHGKQGQLDLVSSDYNWFCDGKEGRLFSARMVYDDQRLYGKVLNPEKEPTVLKGNFINPACLFRRTYLIKNRIFHNETPGSAFQDRGFSFLALIYADRIMVTRDQFYYYRHDNPDSSIGKSGNDIGIVMREYRMTGVKLKERGIEKYLPELFRREYGSCRYAFARCAPEYKQECLYMISREFSDYEGDGVLDFGVFPKEWKAEVRKIIEDPGAFYQSYLDLKRELHDKLGGYDHFIIYGAGVVGQRIYDEMFEEDRLKLEGFCVTKPEGNDVEYKSCRIKCIDDYVNMRKTAAVVVGVSKPYKAEVITLLQEKGFLHIITLDTAGANI